MRNSISLSVYFLLVLQCDVKKLFLKIKVASEKMKLIPLTILLISLAVDVKAQKFRQDFPFPPHFQTPNVGLFSSDSSMYLPPESHTALPYFPMKNVNNLQYPLLPPTGTKAPSMFPNPYPFIISTTLMPTFDDDDDDEDHGRIRLSPSPTPQNFNQTVKNTEPPKEKRELRPIPKNMYPPPIPIQNRNDVKFPFNPTPAPAPAASSSSPLTTPPARRMIISAETQRSDVDQVKAPSFFQGPQFLPAGQGIYVSSSTEPAIPILRLSNEMDLDGSFSYEALGADQTHYVQHSRMENMGTDKEEQVVEGSYSYVGDNGHTYTVHYVADSNGFRASGDHLPVAPPVPEIIQRAVQYNLAEEAKRPPHLKSWQDDGSNNEIRDNDKSQQFSLPPTRNLFTGRTPEAFSYSFSQGSNTGNNLVTAASNQAPVKTVDYTTEQVKANNGPISPQITFLASQGAHVPSLNSVQNTISRMFSTEKPTMPQIVNYEAQAKEVEQDPNKGLWRWQYGINANSLNQNPNKDTISRSSGEGDDVMINFSDMTPEQYTKMIQSQLEYNADSTANNQFTQHENSIANSKIRLTGDIKNSGTYFDSQNSQIVNNNYQNFQDIKNARDQYNHNFNGNQNEEKINYDRNVLKFENNNNLIGENKQIPENQYVQGEQQNQIHNHYIPNLEPAHKVYSVKETDSVISNDYVPKIIDNSQFISTSLPISQSIEWNKKTYQSTSKPIENRNLKSDHTKILTQKDFMFPTQTVTQSYDFEEGYYEPRKIKALVNNAYNSNVIVNNVKQGQHIFDKGVSSDSPFDQKAVETQQTTTSEPYISTVRDLKFDDFVFQGNSNHFKPIVTTTTTEAPEETEVTTENIVEDIIQNNVFLKSLFSSNKGLATVNDNKNANSDNTEKKESPADSKQELYSVEYTGNGNLINHKIVDESKKVLHNKIDAKPKADNVPKLVQYQAKPANDVKLSKKKSADLAELLNYISLKNPFESSKVKPKGRIVTNNFDQRKEIRFIPMQQEKEEKEVHSTEHKNTAKTLNKEHQEELRGLIKNYKVLQRNNNNMRYENKSLKTELSPPPLKSPSLPPLGRAGPSMKSYLPPIFVL